MRYKLSKLPSDINDSTLLDDTRSKNILERAFVNLKPSTVKAYTTKILLFMNLYKFYTLDFVNQVDAVLAIMDSLEDKKFTKYFFPIKLIAREFNQSLFEIYDHYIKQRFVPKFTDRNIQGFSSNVSGTLEKVLSKSRKSFTQDIPNPSTTPQSKTPKYSKESSSSSTKSLSLPKIILSNTVYTPSKSLSQSTTSREHLRDTPRKTIESLRDNIVPSPSTTPQSRTSRHFIDVPSPSTTPQSRTSRHSIESLRDNIVPSQSTTPQSRNSRRSIESLRDNIIPTPSTTPQSRTSRHFIDVPSPSTTPRETHKNTSKSLTIDTKYKKIEPTHNSVYESIVRGMNSKK